MRSSMFFFPSPWVLVFKQNHLQNPHEKEVLLKVGVWNLELFPYIDCFLTGLWKPPRTTQIWNVNLEILSQKLPRRINTWEVCIGPGKVRPAPHGPVSQSDGRCGCPKCKPTQATNADRLTRLTYAQVPSGKLKLSLGHQGLPNSSEVANTQRCETRVLGLLFSDWFPHLESHLGQEGEFVLLKQRLAGVEKDGVGDALGQGGDAPRHVLHLVSLLDGSVEQHVESLGNSRHC